MQIYRCLHIDDASQGGLLRASYIRLIFKKCYSCMANFEPNFPQSELKFINQVKVMMPRIISNAYTVIFCPKSGKNNRGKCQRHLCLNVELQQLCDHPLHNLRWALLKPPGEARENIGQFLLTQITSLCVQHTSDNY